MNNHFGSVSLLERADLKDKISVLIELYRSIPPTKCERTDCGDWCCSKLDSSKDEAGNYMSLPLIYTIEYYAIIEYITHHFSVSMRTACFDPPKKEPMCVFRKHGADGGCMIYPVRPFSCRVYGRSVPDIFWGIEHPKGSAKAIECAHCVPVCRKDEDRFLARYPAIWDTLLELSLGLPVIPRGCDDIFRSVTGLDRFAIMGWYERNELLSKDRAWFESQFEAWWNIYSNLL